MKDEPRAANPGSNRLRISSPNTRYWQIAVARASGSIAEALRPARIGERPRSFARVAMSFPVKPLAP